MHEKKTRRNIDVIRELPMEELAKMLIHTNGEEDIGYDWDEEPYSWGIVESYVTTDGHIFDGLGDAVEYEINWLNAEKEG